MKLLTLETILLPTVTTPNYIAQRLPMNKLDKCVNEVIFLHKKADNNF